MQGKTPFLVLINPDYVPFARLKAAEFSVTIEDFLSAVCEYTLMNFIEQFKKGGDE